ncbi:MAG: serine/threonine-protein kinase [Desulfobacteraceae bacterium]|jgi:serine/threonine-protein kinase
MLKKILGAPPIQIFLMSALVLSGMLWPLGPLEYLENRNYDFWSARVRAPENHSIAIVAIDEKSIARLGDWPWPRSRLTEMVELLTSADAQALGICVLYTQPDMNPGLREIRLIQSGISDPQWKGSGQSTSEMLEMLRQAQDRLNQDAHLISAVRRASNSVLPIRFSPNHSERNSADKPSGLLIINSMKAPPLKAGRAQTLLSAIQPIIRQQVPPISAESVQETFTALGGKAGALGHLNLKIDPDGVVRRLPLLVDYHGRLYPALALQLSLKQRNGKFKELSIGIDPFGRPTLKGRHLELYTDGAYHMLVNHDPQWTRERTYPFAQVLDGTVDPEIFKNKVVLIGVTDPAAAPVYRVGIHNTVAMVEITANMLARILSKFQLSRPSWALFLEIVALSYFAFFLIIFIPRVNIRLGAFLLIIFLVTWYAVGVGLLLGYGYWIKFSGPVLLASLGFVLVQFTIFSRMRQLEEMESNKTLGLSYQSQGMLDMAYEKYMQCPVRDTTVKNLLYNLGLDFERKRMFNKAAAVYQHIRTDGTFKDIKDRIARLSIMDDPLSRSANSPVGEATLKADDTTKPTFGRYEILKELGHGAMGTVYLGRDPKINREVAIKTLEYAQVAPGELEEVKERFFREAEAAGKLSHPNIVSIFDAGEEHDMAYIAMERLTGGDLTHHCAKHRLLPTGQVLSIVSQIAAALDYAHKQGVIHRDIKPGNIMLLDDDRVKVTDFGIARVVDASRTGTGIVLGTPSYMSPEQVTGKKVDGRSDLFSLGIVFYQLLTGVKPFKGESITAIMYAIAHHPHTPLSESASDLPACIAQIVNKLLTKGVTRRFKSALELSKALERCKEEL